MKLAVTVWEDRIAPLFDTANRVALYRIAPGKAVPAPEGEIDMSLLAPGIRITRLMSEGVDVLVCGAISRPLQRLLESVGIEIIAGVCGPVHEILQTLAAGRRPETPFRGQGGGRGRKARWGRRFGGGPPCNGPRTPFR